MGKHSFISAADVALSGVAPGRSARYVGRVGALAVALGVGVAVATMPGVASATPGSESGSDTNTSANDNDTAANDNAPGGADDVTPGGGDVEPGDDEDAADEDAADEEADEEESEEVDDEEVTEEVIADEAEAEVELELDPNDAEPPVVVTDPVVPVVVVDPVVVERPTEQREQITPQPVVVPDTSATPPAQEPAPEAPPVQLLMAGEDNGMAASQLRTVDSVEPQSLTAPVAPQPAAAPFSFISTVVSALVVPLLAPVGPISPAQTPVLFAVLAWVRRQFEHTFANQAPVLVDNQDTELVDEDTVTGSVTGTDADPEDTVTYSHSGGNPNADISVDQNGNWTYTAPESWDGTTEYTDSFTITATDEDNSPSHLHGFLSLFAPDRGHTASQVITVTIPPADTNSPPDVTVGDPSDPDPETGAVTFTVTTRDEDGDPLAVTASDGAQVSAPVYDEASDSYVYTVTYTPTAQQRLDAYTTTGEDVVPVTISVSDGVNDPISETVSVTIDPVAVVATPGATATVPAGSAVLPVVTGADGTAAVTTSGPSGTTIAVLRPGSANPETVTVPGALYGKPVVGADGTVALTTYTGAGSETDPYETTVTVLRPGAAPISETVTGFPMGEAVIGADGTVAQTTYTGWGTTEDPYETTVTVLRPNGSAPITETVAGYPVGSGAVVGDDGTVAVTTRRGAGTAADPHQATTTVLRPGQAETLSYTAAGFPGLAPPVVGADGTVAQTYYGAGSANETTLAVLRPGQPGVDTVTIEGAPRHLPVVGDDGTVALTTYVFSPDPNVGQVTTVTVLRPGEPVPDTATLDGIATGAPQVSTDGAVVQSAYTATESTFVMLLPGESTSIVETGPGYRYAVLGDDGTVALATTPGVSPQVSTVSVLRPGDSSPEVVTIANSLQEMQVGPDGTVAVTSLEGSGTVADPYVTTLTVARPGDAPVSVTLPENDGYRISQVGSDGTVLVYTSSTDSDQTTVIVLRPDDAEPVIKSVDGTPVANSPAVLNEDGTVTMLTKTGSSYTQYTITFADAPASVV